MPCGVKQATYSLLIIAVFLFSRLYARTEDNTPQLKEGNLALSASQQPGPLFSYGQNIVERGDVQLINYVDWYHGKNTDLVHYIPGILYGINDDLSLYFNIPVVPLLRIGDTRSSGMQDVYVQGEYAFYNNDTYTSSTQATMLAALYLPTGSPSKNPPTGVGAPSFFIGATASYMSIAWYLYAALSGIITTSNGEQQFGNTLFYQAGIGRNIIGNADGWIVTPILELSGTQHGQDMVGQAVTIGSHNSAIFVGPSVWISSKKIYIQTGLCFTVFQTKSSLNANNKYLFACDIGWKFN